MNSSREYLIYPNDIWEYLNWDYLDTLPDGDKYKLHYLPTRYDRDSLKAGQAEGHRIQIWDYFFRIREEDVGKPQQSEIKKIRKALDEEIKVHQQKISELNEEIVSLTKQLKILFLRRVLLGFSSLIVGFIILYRLSVEQKTTSLSTLFVLPIIIYGFIMIIGIGFATSEERNKKEEFEKQVLFKNKVNQSYIAEALRRIDYLEQGIGYLKNQLPQYPSDEKIRVWLEYDFKRKWKKAIETTGIPEKMRVSIKGTDNPIPVLGPGELQNPDKIPPVFYKKINANLYKHLHARRSYENQRHEKLDVLYGVYYIEYLVVAEDMLATYGFFFDFITGRVTAEHITEQYYKDVVAIATSTEFRLIEWDDDKGEVVQIQIRDAPTFTLSLASGEKRTVTFVNKDYFMEIKEELGIHADKVENIFWIQLAEDAAKNTIKALRKHLRDHKGNEGNKYRHSL